MRRALNGRWRGEYSYDDASLELGTWSFEWYLEQGWLGGVHGTSEETDGERPAILCGRFRKNKLGLWKTYSDDPFQFMVFLPDGSRGTSIELFESAAWSEWVQATAAHVERPEAHIIEALARDMTTACRRLRYAGALDSSGRLEGAWLLPRGTMPWSGIEVPETTGTWWAHRVS